MAKHRYSESKSTYVQELDIQSIHRGQKSRPHPKISSPSIAIVFASLDPLLAWTSAMLKSSNAFLELQRVQGDRRALKSPRPIIEVVKGPAKTLVKHVGGTESEGTIVADREPSGDDGACLRRSIKLKLVVGCNVPSTALLVFEDTIFEGDSKRTWLLADHQRVPSSAIGTELGRRRNSTR